MSNIAFSRHKPDLPLTANSGHFAGSKVEVGQKRRTVAVLLSSVPSSDQARARTAGGRSPACLIIAVMAFTFQTHFETEITKHISVKMQ
jgi:hypothetical protein